MSVRSYLSLALALSITAACGSESPATDKEDDPIEADDDGDDTADDSEDDLPPEDEDDDGDDTAIKDAGNGGAIDAGRKDAGPVADTGAKDAGPKSDGGGGSTTDASAGGADGGGGGGGGGEKGECCDDGNCLCHGPVPSALTAAAGPFKTATLRLSTGTVYYPTDAEPPFAGVALCGGFLNTGPEMNSWGPMYASHGIVTIITGTGAADVPDIRASKLLASVEELKKENTKAGSPLMGKMSDRFGTSGYSMGGGGTTIAASRTPALKTSVGLAAWGGSGANTKVPTLLLCGASDSTAPCSMSQSVYRGIPEATPKMMFNIPGTSHFNWFGPTDAGRGLSGQYALAFQKVYLEGDTRWKSLLTTRPSSGTITTNIQ